MDIAGKRFIGKQVVTGGVIGLSALALYGLRKYFTERWFYLNKDLAGKNVVITRANCGIGMETARRLL